MRAVTVVCTILLCQVTWIQAEAERERTVVHVHNHNTNSNSAYTTIEIGDPVLMRCHHLYGKKFKSCMNRLPLEEFHKILLAMNNRARRDYDTLLDDKERIRLRSEFSQEQWDLLVDKDPHFTKDIDMLVEAYRRTQRSFL